MGRRCKRNADKKAPTLLGGPSWSRAIVTVNAVHCLSILTCVLAFGSGTQVVYRVSITRFTVFAAFSPAIFVGSASLCWLITTTLTVAVCAASISII